MKIISILDVYSCQIYFFQSWSTNNSSKKLKGFGVCFHGCCFRSLRHSNRATCPQRSHQTTTRSSKVDVISLSKDGLLHESFAKIIPTAAVHSKLHNKLYKLLSNSILMESNFENNAALNFEEFNNFRILNEDEAEKLNLKLSQNFRRRSSVVLFRHGHRLPFKYTNMPNSSLNDVMEKFFYDHFDSSCFHGKEDLLYKNVNILSYNNGQPCDLNGLEFDCRYLSFNPVLLTTQCSQLPVFVKID